MFLVQSSFPVLSFIIDPIAKLMGFIINLIFEGFSAIGVVNLGLCILVFTFVIKMLMLPMSIKQQKFSKMSQLVQPEINKIQKKYEGRQDQASMLKMQEETKAVYEKYGISMSGGCLQMFIQLPILMALYQVIRNMPFYIPSLKEIYTQIAEPLMGISGYESIITKIGDAAKATYKLAENPVLDDVIGYISQFKTDSWNALMEAVPALEGVISEASSKIIDMNQFVAGINIADAPGFRISIYLIIPVAAAFFQWLAMKTMNSNTDKNNPAASMTNSMAITMPLMSFILCFSFPAGIGIYWVATSVFQVLQQVVLNKYFDNMDMEAEIAKNMEKASKKKKKPSLTQKMMEKAGLEQPQQEAGSISSGASHRTKNYNKKYDNSKAADDINYSDLNRKPAKPGSMAEKAGLVRDYNERTKKGGNK